MEFLIGFLGLVGRAWFMERWSERAREKGRRGERWREEGRKEELPREMVAGEGVALGFHVSWSGHGAPSFHASPRGIRASAEGLNDKISAKPILRMVPPFDGRSNRFDAGFVSSISRVTFPRSVQPHGSSRGGREIIIKDNRNFYY